MSAYDLPLPCNHAASKWAYRISSHSDADVDAAGGIKNITGAFCSVWVCARPECVDKGKRYVAASALCAPVVNEGTRQRSAS
jgi:hypothetical protein